MRALAWVVVGAGVLAAGPAAAHGGTHPAARFGWTWDASVTLPLAVAAIAFAVGWIRLYRRSAAGTARLRRHALVFAGGWLILALALVSPLHEAGEHSFTAHMAEHELLMLAAAPLLVLSQPLGVMLWAGPRPWRAGLGAISRWRPISVLWRGLHQPVTATLLQAAALWLWHTPGLFDVALANGGWHVVQHLSFLVTALLFWSAVLHHRPRNYGLSALCLFATSMVTGALGALMAFSQSPWYAGYSQLGMTPMGLSPLEDQQVAGMLMWVPGGLVHAGAALAAVAAALKPQTTQLKGVTGGVQA